MKKKSAIGKTDICTIGQSLGRMKKIAVKIVYIHEELKIQCGN